MQGWSQGNPGAGVQRQGKDAAPGSAVGVEAFMEEEEMSGVLHCSYPELC